jgi:hypothetical protein
LPASCTAFSSLDLLRASHMTVLGSPKERPISRPTA